MTTVRIQAGKRFVASIRTPGDKSISHRSAMFASLAEGRSTITGFLESEDCLSTVNAMRTLGVMYYNGLNVPQDREKGLYWYRRAAEKGSATAKAELAQLEAAGK